MDTPSTTPLPLPTVDWLEDSETVRLVLNVVIANGGEASEDELVRAVKFGNLTKLHEAIWDLVQTGKVFIRFSDASNPEVFTMRKATEDETAEFLKRVAA